MYAVAPDGRVQLQAVQTGVSVDGMTEIKSGIKAGEVIVFDGQSRLNPGARVKATIMSAQEAATASASAPAANMDAPS